MEKKIIITIAVIASLFFVGNVIKHDYKSTPEKIAVSVKDPSSTPVQKQTSNYFSYKGENGKSALGLLGKYAAFEQDSSGLVASINNRKAESNKHEYWAFYVNGKMEQVGPADYMTKDADVIEWKIDHY